MTAEEQRLAEDRTRKAYWRKWGPYLSERQWGTVREDYSFDGAAWDYFSHDQARSRAYRWGEDGIAGISDNHQRLCFAIALWNGEDPILKERLFGLTATEGNHGEDVKEYYFYLDNTPTHAYMKYLYKYPQTAFPYEQLVAENKCRSVTEPEFELVDTGIFEHNKYFDIFVEYAKATAEDILIQIHIVNRGIESKTLHLLPTLWFRNNWSWGYEDKKPILKLTESNSTTSVISAFHPTLGQRWLYCQNPHELLFTENETNHQALYGASNRSLYVKDGINNYLVGGQKDAVNRENGTKFAACYQLNIGAGQTETIRLRLTNTDNLTAPFTEDFDLVFQQRQLEANEFYQRIATEHLSDEARNIQRQAFAGLLWSKQFYHYVVEDWLRGDPAHSQTQRQNCRNDTWQHIYSDDIIAVPDKWEFPWLAAWDLAFHTISLAIVDPDFAKRQLQRLTREWYMHPNGQLPAYEWNFSDVNPPVHAWAVWRVYQIEKELYGRTDKHFLERVFQKLLLNFTWWVNRKDKQGNNVFQGGFLGLDNIGIFDRSSELPTGGYMDQSDGTSWMGMYSLNMLVIALELAKDNSTYEDIASKFFEHFLYITDAMNHMGGNGVHLWDEEDNFYYDVLNLSDNQRLHLKVRSLVGLIPIFAVETLATETIKEFPGFQRRMEWFLENRPNLTRNIACMEAEGVGETRLLAIVKPSKLKKILEKLLDENEFLSNYGIRSVSRYHAEHPYTLEVDGYQHQVDYEPAESTTGMFGGNSNWRGPVWLPMNYLIIESLQKFHHYLGDEFQVEYPKGSGQERNLREIALLLSQRLMRIFLKDSNNQRPVHGKYHKFQTDPHWRDLILFHEYFHGDNGAGLGASHQTGWTALVANLMHECGKYCQ